MQLDIDGDEVVEEAMASFKDLPREEQMKVITSLEKVRTNLVNITEVPMSPPIPQTTEGTTPAG